MTRFYFHTRDGNDYLADDTGIDLVDLSSACREARLGARRMLAAGAVLQVITFRSAMSWNGLDVSTRLCSTA